MYCVKGESNPQFNLGRVACYHYTIDAICGWGRDGGGCGMCESSLPELNQRPFDTQKYFLLLQSNALPTELREGGWGGGGGGGLCVRKLVILY